MNINAFLLGLLVMSVVTYLVRAVPFGLMQKKITNRFFCSVLYYIPYTVLSAMTFPAILTSTSSLHASVCGMLVALLLAYKGKGLVRVAFSAALATLAMHVILTCIHEFL